MTDPLASVLLEKLLNPPSDGYRADYVELEGRRLRIDADYDLSPLEVELVKRLKKPTEDSA